MYPPRDRSRAKPLDFQSYNADARPRHLLWWARRRHFVDWIAGGRPDRLGRNHHHRSARNTVATVIEGIVPDICGIAKGNQANFEQNSS
jgi:hypothetical protein